MPRTLTLDYWIDDGWYVGKIREVPGVFSQGESLAELKANVQDVYRLMVEDDSVQRETVETVGTSSSPSDMQLKPQPTAKFRDRRHALPLLE